MSSEEKAVLDAARAWLAAEDAMLDAESYSARRAAGPKLIAAYGTLRSATRRLIRATPAATPRRRASVATDVE